MYNCSLASVVLCKHVAFLLANPWFDFTVANSKPMILMNFFLNICGFISGTRLHAIIYAISDQSMIICGIHANVCFNFLLSIELIKEHFFSLICD